MTLTKSAVTVSDIAIATFMVSRISYRKTMETLQQRIGSKYFKNIVIQNVPWKNIPPNFPKAFLDENPYDFEVKFTTLGCNMLKCYYDVKTNCQPGSGSAILINEREYACSEACYAVYNEVLEFLKERFGNVLTSVLNNTVTDNHSSKPIPFETWSIHVKESNEEYCGVQLSALKTLALRPSSRWSPSDENDAQSYQKNPVAYAKNRNTSQLKKAAAGLIDAPPLSWNIQHQNINFNPVYCKRFRKYYDSQSDQCHSHVHRQILGFILGTQIVNQFSDDELLDVFALTGGSSILIDEWDKQDYMDVDRGYSEKVVPQSVLEKELFVDKADVVVSSENVSLIEQYTTTTYNSLDVIINNLNSEFSDLLTLLKDGAITITEIEVTTQVPKIISRLLKYFSENILRDALQDVLSVMMAGASAQQMVVQLLVMIIRSSMIEMGIQFSLRLLSGLSTSLSVILSVGLVLLPLELYLSINNIGGYNQEMTHATLDNIRKEMINKLLEQDINSGQYIKLGPPQSVTTPQITPDMIYLSAIYEVIRLYPQCTNIIAMDGTTKNHLEEGKMILDLLNQFEVNSLGQAITHKINSETYEKDTKVIDMTHHIIHEAKYKHYPIQTAEFEIQEVENLISSSKWDILILCLALIFLISSLMLFKTQPYNYYALGISSFFYIYWSLSTPWLG